MKKVMYIHGAFSAFKPNSEKVKGLSKNYNVVGLSYSMEKDFNENKKEIVDFCKKENVDFVVGTSLGGLYASVVSSELCIPAILINPCVEPVKSLSTIVGKQKNFTTGQDEEFTQELANSFPEKAPLNANMFVFVGLKDNLISPEITIKMADSSRSKIFVSKEDDHYWEFFEYNKLIDGFVNSADNPVYTTVCNPSAIEIVERLKRLGVSEDSLLTTVEIVEKFNTKNLSDD